MDNAQIIDRANRSREEQGSQSPGQTEAGKLHSEAIRKSILADQKIAEAVALLVQAHGLELKSAESAVGTGEGAPFYMGEAAKIDKKMYRLEKA